MPSPYALERIAAMNRVKRGKRTPSAKASPAAGQSISGATQTYAAGRKMYGGGRDFPTMGKVDPMGYKNRDAENKAKRDAMLARLKARGNQRFMSPENLRGGRS